jgi:hypothetical protein
MGAYSLDVLPLPKCFGANLFTSAGASQNVVLNRVQFFLAIGIESLAGSHNIGFRNTFTLAPQIFERSHQATGEIDLIRRTRDQQFLTSKHKGGSRLTRERFEVFFLRAS